MFSKFGAPNGNPSDPNFFGLGADLFSKHLETNKKNAPEVVEVYMQNFFEELERVSNLVEEYNYIAMV